MSENSGGAQQAPPNTTAGSGGQSNPSPSTSGGRNGRNRNKQNDSSDNAFKGATPEIGHIYSLSRSRNIPTFADVTQAIAEYATAKVAEAEDFRLALDVNKLAFAPLQEPDDPPPNATKVVQYRWELEYKTYLTTKTRRETACKKVFPIITGQCTKALREKIEAEPTWKNISGTNDVIGLLKLIQASVYTGKSSSRNEVHSRIEAVRNLYSFRQTRKMSTTAYRDQFVHLLGVVEHLGGWVGVGAHKAIDDNSDGTATKAQIDSERDVEVAVMFLLGSDPHRYGQLIADVENDYTRGIKGYPDTITKAYDMLVNYAPPPNLNNNQAGPQDLGAAFAQHEDSDTGRNQQNSGGRGGGGRGRGGGRGGGRGSGRGGREGTGTGGREGTGTGTDSNNQTSTTSEQDYINSPSYSYDRVHAFLQQHGPLQGVLLLLDSCSSVNLFSDTSLLHGIFEAPKPLRLVCTTGATMITKQGYFGNYPDPVWCYPDGVANILSLSLVQDLFRCTMDTAVEDSITVHVGGGKTLRFTPMNGLYGMHFTDSSAASSCLLSTVKEIASGFTRRDQQNAVRARRMQNIIMNPTDRTMQSVAIKHLRSPVAATDVKNATDIFGTNVHALKGKTVHRPNPHVQATVEPVPPEILERYGRVTIGIDVIFVNSVPFLLTVSRHLRFSTVQPLENRQATTIRKHLDTVVTLYEERGFMVSSIVADPEFAALQQWFPMMNTCAMGEHVPEVERFARTLKERSRCTYSRTPFKCYPRLCVVRLVQNANLWLNALPHPDGVTPDYSPRFLLKGWELTYDKHVRLEFGTYVQTHEDSSSDMTDRTLGAICLGPTGNSQGGHYFMSLASGDKITRHQWTELPMPADVVKRVNAIGRRQKMPHVLSFSTRHGTEIGTPFSDLNPPDEDDNDSDYDPDGDSAGVDSDDDFSYDSDSGHDDDNDDNDDDENHGDGPEPPNDNSSEGGHSSGDDPSIETDGSSEDASDNFDNGIDVPAGNQISTEESDYPESSAESEQPDPQLANNNDLESHMEIINDTIDYYAHPPYDEDPSLYENTGVDGESTGVDGESTGVDGESTGVDGESTGVEVSDRLTAAQEFELAEDEGRANALNNAGRSKRKRKQKIFSDEEYAYLTALLDVMSPEDEVFTLVTAQMSAKKGVKLFGQRGEDAITTELEQLLNRKVMHGVNAKSLSRAQRRAALQYLMFLKEKRSGKVKGRGCADGRKQRLYKTKEETSSPTVTTEALFLTSLIDAVEGRNIITCDIPGAFMQADIDELIHIRIDGPILEALVRLDPKYEKICTIEGGKRVAYAELDKALYGTVQASLLFWKKLSKYLVEDLGFQLNPYDECVANKMINGKQCTIAWHVDDLKISHVSQHVIEGVVDALQSEFGKEAPLTVNRGKVHDYLGMTIDWSEQDAVIFTMYDYIETILKEMKDDMARGPSTTPAANHLFMVYDDAEKLDEEKKDLFHHITAMLLYLCRRARPDLQTAVSFLTTRVQSPDVHDYKKLARCLRYLRDTKHYLLRLKADSLQEIRWWVDASYAVHPDMKSHTGATLSFGTGSPYSICTKHKINSRSSTEAEVIAVNDVMSMVLWTRHFLEAQGFEITRNVIYQDNQSAMLLEQNGRRSSTKRTRHFEVRYFFITDNVSRNKVQIEYCPTDDMVGDFYTKPVQGSKYRYHLKAIMGMTETELLRPPQECVEDTESEIPMDEGQTTISYDSSIPQDSLATRKSYAEVAAGK